MKNIERIQNAVSLTNFEWDGTNLKTYAEWRKAGYQVIKGEKAFLKVELWKPFTKKVKDKEGKTKKEKRFKLVNTALFTPDQVKEIAEEDTETA